MGISLVVSSVSIALLGAVAIHHPAQRGLWHSNEVDEEKRRCVEAWA
ncbi:hypothetical protein QZG57_00065 [Corynebacterium glucuronolyticum]